MFTLENTRTTNVQELASTLGRAEMCMKENSKMENSMEWELLSIPMVMCTMECGNLDNDKGKE